MASRAETTERTEYRVVAKHGDQEFVPWEGFYLSEAKRYRDRESDPARIQKHTVIETRWVDLDEAGEKP